MASLQNQTSINSNRFFFATKEDGEQELYPSTIVAGPITDFYVGINGNSGNLVQINQMPDIIGTSSVGGEGMVYWGTSSDYKTLSSINTAATGGSMSIDRVAGSGKVSIENYGTNGSAPGFEFLCRGVNSALVSTSMDSWMSAQGAPGATAVLFPSGNFAVGSNLLTTCAVSLAAQTGPGGQGCFNIADLSGAGIGKTRWSFFKYGFETGGNTGTNLALGSYNDAGGFLDNIFTVTRSTGEMSISNLSSVNTVAYPQNLLSTVATANQTGVSVPSATPTVIYTLTNNDLIPGAVYNTDVGFQWEVGDPGLTGTFIELGVRLGGNGNYNYDVPQFIPSGGTANRFIANSVGQFTDMGTTNKDIDIIAYHQNATAISISTNYISGNPISYLKQVT